MKKFLIYGMAFVAILSSAALTSCGDDDDDTPAETVQNYDLTISFAAGEGVDLSKVSDLKVTVSGPTSQTLTLATAEAKALNLTQGVYSVTVTGNLTDEAGASVSGSTTNIQLYSAQSVSVKLEKGAKSGLVFKTIYTSGGAQWYMLDGFFEIANNSDEVQYLDGLILSAPQGNLDAENGWQAAGMGDLYGNGQGPVLAFPGNGTDYPLQPGQFIVLANEAMNHKTAYTDDSQAQEYAKSPDLSGADWEIYLGTGDVDNENVPNVKVIYSNNRYMKAFGIGVAGRSYLMAKLPVGMSPEAFAADSTNIQFEPNNEYAFVAELVIPSKYVIDAVDIYTAEDHVCTFLPKDDATGIQGNDMYSGKSHRRKVAKIENGRVYYKDTNSSADDFKNGQDNTPGVTPTEVDR